MSDFWTGRFSTIHILTLTLLTWRIWWALNNASKWQMRFNSAFNELRRWKHSKIYGILFYKQRIFISQQLCEGEDRITINGFIESRDLLGIMSPVRHRNPHSQTKQMQVQYLYLQDHRYACWRNPSAVLYTWLVLSNVMTLALDSTDEERMIELEIGFFTTGLPTSVGWHWEEVKWYFLHLRVTFPAYGNCIGRRTQTC